MNINEIINEALSLPQGSEIEKPLFDTKLLKYLDVKFMPIFI